MPSPEGMAVGKVPASDDPPTGAFGSSDSDPTAQGQEPLGPVSGVHSNPPLFEEGRIIAGRYRILGFLARGGMGEVYEALDLDLAERIALKSIGSDQVHSGDALLRFKRELSLARKVTHPNVCRTYDLVHHLQPDGSRVACLSMELLMGESLSRRLRHGGRMDPAMALNLAQQMVAALEAAHAVGVIHRDLKPSNVMLVKSSSGEGSLRAVITDFGLAFSQETLDLSHASSGGTFQGTPAYMSPEQVEGAAITPRSDIYSLGLVIFEMLTGEVPFKGGNPVSAATRRLKEAAPSPRDFVEDLDPWWEKILARCLARDPEDRYSSAKEFREALDPDPPAVLHRPRHKGRTLAAAGAVALLLGGGGMVAWRSANGAAPLGGMFHRSSLRPSIAVLGFQNIGSDPRSAWRATALAEMLGTELSLDEKLRLIPGSEVARVREELGLSGKSELGQAVLQRVSRNLGTDMVVSGTFIEIGATAQKGAEKGGEGAFRVDLKLLDARSGEVLTTIREEGTDREILGVVHRAGQQLRGRLALGAGPAEAMSTMVASYPRNLESLRLYSQAIEKLRVYDSRAAIELLERANASDGSCPLIHSALAEAWTQMRNDGKAKAEAKAAMDCHGSLNREGKLQVEGRYALVTHQWEKAISAFQSLYGFFPDNFQYGLDLAMAQRMAGRLAEAQRTLGTLRSLPRPMCEDPRLDIEAADLAKASGHEQEALVFGSNAARKAQASGASLILAQARLREASSLLASGSISAALSRLDEARAIFERVGNLSSQLSVERRIGALAANQGDVTGAKRILEHALAINVQLDSPVDRMQILRSLAVIKAIEGDPKGALDMIRAVLRENMEFRDPYVQAEAMGSLTWCLLECGDLKQALAQAQAMEDYCISVGNQKNLALAQSLKGQCSLALGLMEEAVRETDKSMAAGGMAPNEWKKADALLGLAKILRAKGDWKGAEDRFRECGNASEGLGAKAVAADARLGLAQVLAAQGHSREAEQEISKALELLRTTSSPEQQARAALGRTRALLLEGNTRQASEIFPWNYRSGFIETRMLAVALKARLEPNTGKAAADLQRALKEARDRGYIPLQFELRLSQTELAMKEGKSAKNHEKCLVTLRQLKSEAEAKGFGDVARRAARLLERSA